MKRRTEKPSDMSTLLHSTQGTLAQIAKKTNSLSKISTIVRQICPDLPEDVWWVANVKQHIVVIEVTSSAWSQRLQFEKNNIARQLEKITKGELTSIEIKVSPYRNKREVIKQVMPDKTQFISQQTAENLREVAERAPDKLKAMLLKLAALADKKQD
ncbi:DUF721 domain-containing protein [Thalassotalea fusca]